MIKILPVILCGGSGTRLWPLSRSSFPKQYLTIDEREKLSFLQKTVKRLEHFENIDKPIIICNEEHRFIVAEQMRDIKIKPKSILLEPVGRNTAPAITIAALKALEGGKDPILFVLPSDHLIKNNYEFKKTIESAVTYCNSEKLITFGVVPNKAETGYGYIEASKILDSKALKAEEIKNFIEKPDKEIAQKFIKDKRYSWNSGIFLFKASTFINEIKKFQPDIYKFCSKALSQKFLDLDFQRLDKKYFESCDDISIDKAIMEKTNSGMVLPLDAGWSDIGSWNSMWEISDKDDDGNVVFGDVVLKSTSNSFLRSEKSLLVGLGIKNLVVVETTDAILIANKDKVQDLKNFVFQLGLEGKKEVKIHKTIFRPWGFYTSIAEDFNWQVKKITVKKGQSLSLQLHQHRSEHWIVVSGKALVEIGEEKKILYKNQSTYIPQGIKHRLSNPSDKELVLIEVQSGNYLGEDDIIRFNDKYGRK